MRRTYTIVRRCLLFLLLITIAKADAQNAKPATNEVPVSGIVKDRLGATVADVSVTIQGKPGRGSKTDGAGHFSILAEPKSSLVFTHINYKEQVMPVNNT